MQSSIPNQPKFFAFIVDKNFDIKRLFQDHQFLNFCNNFALKKYIKLVFGGTPRWSIGVLLQPTFIMFLNLNSNIPARTFI